MQMSNIQMDLYQKITSSVDRSFAYGYAQDCTDQGTEGGEYEEFFKASNFILRVSKPMKNLSDVL